MYGWMKFVEVAPGRYDWAVKLMTAGRLDQIKDQIAAAVNAGDKVLDIGCGTGTLAIRCLERGANVTGIDASEQMLDQARKHATAAGVNDRLDLVRDSVTQLRKHFDVGTFDIITSTMALGEFPREYLEFILRDCKAVLKPSGKLIVADEVWPERPLPRFFYRIGLALMWIPQFLILRRAFFPIKDLRAVIEASGFEVVRSRSWFGSSFQLFYGVKSASEPVSGQATAARAYLASQRHA
jgi:demethylmenaquinone methyltransferase/2-methoxy-6-polyprenyl-1,4-benzoquinol methylase